MIKKYAAWSKKYSNVSKMLFIDPKYSMERCYIIAADGTHIEYSTRISPAVDPLYPFLYSTIYWISLTKWTETF